MATSTADRSLADPRTRFVRDGDGVRIIGWRCQGCGYPMTQQVTVCMVCRGEVAEDTFATEGEVWASTCLRVRVPGHEPPFAVAYLVLDGGPRILVHTRGDEPLATGSRARVIEATEDGDLVATPLGEDDEAPAAALPHRRHRKEATCRSRRFYPSRTSGSSTRSPSSSASGARSSSR